MSEHEKEAALAFARAKPTEWDAFYTQWVMVHPEPEATGEKKDLKYGSEQWLQEHPEPEEDGDKKRRVKKSEP